jgi:predicted dehydrogenase
MGSDEVGPTARRHDMKKWRIGIIGCGGIAHAHINGYRAIAGDTCNVVAGCDPDEGRLESFCDRYGVAHRFGTARELLESDEVDVISLLTPPAVRAEAIFPAAERGIHMLVEKPFAESIGDALAFVEAAEQGSATLAVNQSLRFMPDVLAAREIIAAGEIGDVRVIAHDHFQNRTRTEGWRKDEERLEISIFSIHVLDRIRWLCGKLPEAVAATIRHWDEDVRGETFTALTIQFEGGAVGSMVSSWHAFGIPECRLRVDGTAGSIFSKKEAVLSDEATLTVHRLGEAAERREILLENAGTMNMGESMALLLSAIRGGEQPHHSGRDNLQTMAIVDAAYLSASRGGARVEIEEVWPGLAERSVSD